MVNQPSQGERANAQFVSFGKGIIRSQGLKAPKYPEIAESNVWIEIMEPIEENQEILVNYRLSVMEELKHGYVSGEHNPAEIDKYTHQMEKRKRKAVSYVDIEQSLFTAETDGKQKLVKNT